MAFTINVDDAKKNDGQSDMTPEEKWIPAGDTPARLVGCIELGLHVPTYGVGPDGKPKPAVYDKGKRKGQVKDPSFEIQTLWATGCEHTGPDPLYLLGGDYDRIKISDYMWKDPSKLTNKTNFFKAIMLMRELTGVDGSSIPDFIGSALLFSVTNKPNTKSKIEGMQYANTKLLGARSTEIRFKGKVVGDEAEDLPCIGDEEGQFKTMEFYWDNPTKEGYESIKPWHRRRIQEALNFEGSPVWDLLEEYPELKELDKRNAEDTDTPDPDTQADPEADDAPAPDAPPLKGAAAALLAKAKRDAEDAV